MADIAVISHLVFCPFLYTMQTTALLDSSGISSISLILIMSRYRFHMSSLHCFLFNNSSKYDFHLCILQISQYTTFLFLTLLRQHYNYYPLFSGLCKMYVLCFYHIFFTIPLMVYLYVSVSSFYIYLAFLLGIIYSLLFFCLVALCSTFFLFRHFFFTIFVISLFFL